MEEIVGVGIYYVTGSVVAIFFLYFHASPVIVPHMLLLYISIITLSYFPREFGSSLTSQ